MLWIASVLWSNRACPASARSNCPTFSLSTGSGQAEHWSVAVGDPEGFPQVGSLDSSHETIDETTSRTSPSET